MVVVGVGLVWWGGVEGCVGWVGGVWDVFGVGLCWVEVVGVECFG